MSKTIRVLVADHQPILRAGLRAVLNSLPDIEVVAEAADGHVALAQIARYQPHVAIFNSDLRGLDGKQTAARARAAFPDVRVLILADADNDPDQWRTPDACGTGYLSQDAPLHVVELAVRAAAQGETCQPSRMATPCSAAYASINGKHPLERLTPRQREILQRLAEGQTVKVIALQLGISVKTVETHRAQLMDRLDIHNLPGLVRYAIRMGLVPVDC